MFEVEDTQKSISYAMKVQQSTTDFQREIKIMGQMNSVQLVKLLNGEVYFIFALRSDNSRRVPFHSDFTEAHGEVNEDMTWCTNLLKKKYHLLLCLPGFCLFAFRFVMDLCARGNLAKLMRDLPAGISSLLFAPPTLLTTQR